MRKGKQVITSLFLIVLCVTMHAQSDKALALENRLEMAQSDTARVHAYNDLARFYREFDKETAYNYTYEAEKIANLISHQRGLGFVFENYTIIAYRAGDLPVAFDHAMHCLEIAENISDSLLITLAYNNLGLIQRDLGNLDEAIESFEVVLKYERNQGITEGLARGVMNTGATLFSLRELENAARLFQEAWEIGIQLKDTHIIAVALNNLGSYHQQKGDLNTAMTRYKEAREFAVGLQNLNNWGTLSHNIGWVYFKWNIIDTSFIYLNEALTLSREHNLPLIETASLGSLAEVSLKIEDYPQSIAYATKGYQVAKSASKFEQAKKSLRSLHQAYYAIDMYDSAYKYLQEYNAINDSILALQENQRIQQITISNTIAQKDFQLAQQKAKAEKEQDRIQKLFIAFLIVTSLLMGLGYTWYRLRKANIQLEEHNTKIQTQHQQLTELNHIKDRVFSIISHDIRAPLNNIKGLMDILLVQALEEEQRQMIAGKVKKQVRETSDIFDNLLRWSRNQLLKNQTEASSFDIVSLVRESAEAFSQQASQKEIELKCEFPPQLYVFADREMIHTVIRNLLSNAIKFSRPKGEVSISHVIEGTKVILHVTDHGLGIENKKLATIFDLKQNVSTPGTADERGTGLGLPISKEFIEQNGGTMWAQSTVGIGSVFSFSLPMNPQKVFIASEVLETQ
ncbi:MAG: ATP-binding protein [Bacteroidota bacterium]